MGNPARSMEQNEPVLSVECDEPDGKIIRHVRLASLTVERIRFLWERLREFNVLFNDQVRVDFGSFVEHFLLQVDGEFVPAGLIWDVDDVGIFFLNEINEGVSATAHFVFWDRRFSGRRELCRKMIEYVFATYDIERIEVRVPIYAYFTIRAVELIGLRREGRLRHAVKYEDKWFDILVYSILRGEAFENNRPKMSQVCLNCGETYLGEKDGTPNQIG